MPCSPSAASVPAAPPNCSASASRRSRSSRSRERAERRGIAGKLQPERHRQRVLHQRARHRERAAVAAGQRGEALDREVEIGQQRVDRGAQFQHQRGVDDILAGGAPMHEIGRLRVARGDRLRQRLDHGDGDVAGGRLRLDQRRDVVVLGVAGLADRGRAGRRDDADRGLGAGQRASKSSMRCSRARSLMMARIAALA